MTTASLELVLSAFEIYPTTEHITIVGEALPHAFAFFGGVLR